MQREQVIAPANDNSARLLEIPTSVTVKRLSEMLGVSPVEIIKQLMRNGVMANVNQAVDYDTAASVGVALGFKVVKQPDAQEASAKKAQGAATANVQTRPPVVTVMGHVDHGKTTLLDAIRHANVTASEAGGITQHIGAYQVKVGDQSITFIDTPGHEAFTAMRARGARVTDIAVLVVAADDGLMPQTLEAIAHARAAEVPIIVAITKIDKPEADLERVKRQLAEQGLLIEEWGGDVISVSVSGKTNAGISDLLENIVVLSEILELKADPTAPGAAAIIEAGLDKKRGPLATALVQNGTVTEGDCVVVGNTWGKIKALFNDKGKRLKKAGPGTPIKILGLGEVPGAGDILKVVSGEGTARAMCEKLQYERQTEALSDAKALNLTEVFSQIKAGVIKELNIILKTDVQGSIAPIKDSLERLGNDAVKVRVVHAGSGSITEGDVLLALASKGILLGFNTQPTLGAQHLAETNRVDIRLYKIIYEMIDEVTKAVQGMLEPTYVDVVEGRAEVRATFAAGRRQKVAGVLVTQGRITRHSLARLMRGGQVVHESNIASLRRFKNDVNELSANLEGGIGLEGFTDFQEGDIIEAHRSEKVSGASH